MKKIEFVHNIANLCTFIGPSRKIFEQKNIIVKFRFLYMFSNRNIVV